MALGREVADAYISVHGDLANFRKDLTTKGRQAARKAAKSFGEEWEEHAGKELNSRWGAITKAMYSGRDIDWKRVIGEFDGLDDQTAHRINSFLAEMRENGRLTAKEYEKAKAVTRSYVREARLAARTEKERSDLARRGAEINAIRSRDERDAIRRAREETERYNRTLQGMIRNANLGDLERDFKRISDALRKTDWAPMSKDFSDLDTYRDRVLQVSGEMRRQGRMTNEEYRQVNESVRDYVKKAKEAVEEERKRTDAIRQGRIELESASKSLTGLRRKAGTEAMEGDFRRIAQAMATSNWGPMSKDFKSMREFRGRVDEVVDRMRTMGRVSDEEYARVRRSIRDVSSNQKKFGVELDRTSRKFRPIRLAMDKMKLSWARMDSTVRVVLGLILASADQIAVLGSGLGSTLTAFISSIGMAATGLVPLLLGVGSLAPMILLAVEAFDRVRQATPALEGIMANVRRKWEGELDAFAAQWAPAFQNLATTAAGVFQNLNFGEAFGTAMAGVTNAFSGVLTSPGFRGLMVALQNSLPRAAEGFGRGLAGITEGLSSIFAAAAPQAEMLGQAFDGWARQWADRMEALRNDGTLAEIFQRGRESMSALGDLLGPLSSALGNVFMVGSEQGNAMLRRLGELASQFDAWSASLEGQNALREWFENGRRIMESFAPVLSGLSEMLNNLVTERAIQSWEGFTENLGEFLPVLGEILGVVARLEIFNVFATALNMVGQAIRPLIPPLNTVATTISGALMSVLPALAGVFASVADALAPLIGALLPAFATVLQTVAGVVQTLAPIIGTVASTLLSALLPAFQTVSRVIMDLMPFVEDVVEILGEAMMDAISAVAPSIGVLGRALALLVDALGQILVALAPILPMLAQGLARILASLAPVVAQIVVAIAQLATTFVTNLLPALMPIIPVIMGLVETLLNLLIPAFEGVMAAISWIMPFIQTLIEGVLNNVVGLVDGLVTFITGVVDFFKALFTGDFAGAWEAVKQIVSGAVQAVWNFINLWLVAKVVGLIRGALTSISGLFTGAWNGIRGTVTSVLQNISGFISGIMSTIRSTISGVWNTIRGNVTGTVNGVRTAVSNAFSAVRTNVSNIMTSVRTTIRDAWNTAKTTVTNAVNGIKTAVRDKFNEVMDIVRDLPGRILRGLGNLGTLLVDAGKDLIRGLMNGIGSMGGALRDKARDIASGALNAIKNFFGISSPSKVMHQQGRWIGMGLTGGLASMERQVVNEAERIAEAAASGLSPDVMYARGQRAAAGLAEGLKAARGDVTRAFDGLTPDRAIIALTKAQAVRARSLPSEQAAANAAVIRERNITIEKDAIRVETPTRNPEQVAQKVVDKIVQQALV